MVFNIRVHHHPSYIPLFEISSKSSVSVRDLKAAIVERLANEDCIVKVFPTKWYLELSVGTEKRRRLIEINDQDDGDFLAVAGIMDESSVFIEGPTTDTPEGVCQALALVNHQLRQSENRLEARDALQMDLLQKLVDGQSRMIEGIHKLVEGQQNMFQKMGRMSDNLESLSKAADAKRMASAAVEQQVLHQKIAEIEYNFEPLGRETVHLEEGREIEALVAQSRSELEYYLAQAGIQPILAKHPAKPLQAFWEVINNRESFPGVASAMAIVKHPSCGIERAATKADGTFSNGALYCAIGATPLMLAAHANRLDLVQSLVASGANVKVMSEENRTAIQLAAANGNIQMVEYLRSVGATSRSFNPRTSKHDGALTHFESYGKAKCPPHEHQRMRVLLS